MQLRPDFPAQPSLSSGPVALTRGLSAIMCRAISAFPLRKTIQGLASLDFVHDIWRWYVTPLRADFSRTAHSA